MRVLLWTGRILCLLMFLFAAPFYFGYGMPDFARLPWYDLVQLFFITAALLGLLLVWRWEMTAGVILTCTGLLSPLMGLAAGFDFYSPLLFCLAPGLLLLVYVMASKRLPPQEP